MHADTIVGMSFSNVIDRSSSRLRKHAKRSRRHQHSDRRPSSRGAAPVDRRPTYALFAVGIIGIGTMAVPILSGSAAYALSEALGRKARLNYTFRQAPTFYVVIAVATIVGVTVNFVGIKPFQMLYYSAR